MYLGPYVDTPLYLGVWFKGGLRLLEQQYNCSNLLKELTQYYQGMPHFKIEKYLTLKIPYSILGGQMVNFFIQIVNLQ